MRAVIDLFNETDSVVIEAFKVIAVIVLTITAIIVGIKLAWRLFWYLFLEDNNFFRELAGLPEYAAERSSSPPPASVSPFRSLPHSRKNSRHFSTHSVSYDKLAFGNAGDFRARRKLSTASSVSTVDSADIDNYAAHRRSASSGKLSSIYGKREVKHARGLSYTAGETLNYGAGETLKFQDSYLD
ncbi:8736_t:CDS:2 [Paraglomus occultum]|uniref:8736_t:CDS:1 n=1 Tax=Paraglomus occultum TaxID=144539 RepID=A0A9N8VWH1_9GLOM|nr:8736_t:CDS:2 [Paraglomus occultum]